MSERKCSSLNALYDRYCIVVCRFRLKLDLPVTRVNCIGKWSLTAILGTDKSATKPGLDVQRWSMIVAELAVIGVGSLISCFKDRAGLYQGD